MKLTKRDLDEHFRTKAAHHKTRTDGHMEEAGLHKAAAERYAVSDPAHAEFHRNMATLCKAAASSHANVQEHYRALRERLAASPDEHVDVSADVIDDHSDSSRSLQSAAGTAGLLKRMGCLQD